MIGDSDDSGTGVAGMELVAMIESKAAVEDGITSGAGAIGGASGGIVSDSIGLAAVASGAASAAGSAFWALPRSFSIAAFILPTCSCNFLFCCCSET